VSALQLRSLSAAPWGRPLLSGIELSLEPGEIVGLAGPNGAGKSSLLKAIAGDLPLAQGEVLIGGRPRDALHRRELACRLAVLPQLSLLNFPYTVREVVELGRIPHDTGVDGDAAVIDAAMTATDVAHLGRRLYTRLSGGERQRVQLARVFAQVWGPGSPAERVLLLDEPTSALDLSHQQLLAATVRRLAADGCAVVLVIHDLNLVAGVAHRVAVMKDGRVVADGPPAVVLEEALFREVFDVEVTISRHPDLGQPVVINRV
jgi:iron complex transport system ATP-binding protein